MCCQTPFGGYTRANAATTKWLLMKGSSRLLEELVHVRTGAPQRERPIDLFPGHELSKKCGAELQGAEAAALQAANSVDRVPGAAPPPAPLSEDRGDVVLRALTRAVIFSGYGAAVAIPLPANECPPIDLSIQLPCCESTMWLGAAHMSEGKNAAMAMGYSAAEIDGQLHLAMARAYMTLGDAASMHDAEREADRAVRLLQSMQRTRADKRVHPSRVLYNAAMELRVAAKEAIRAKSKLAIKAAGSGGKGGKKKKGKGGKKKR